MARIGFAGMVWYGVRAERCGRVPSGAARRVWDRHRSDGQGRAWHGRRGGDGLVPRGWVRRGKAWHGPARVVRHGMAWQAWLVLVTRG